MEDYMDGGRDKIYKKGDIVYRPAEKWTEHIHRFLLFLHDKGFDKIPHPHGVDNSGNEMVSYVEGIVHNGILPEKVKSDETLVTVAELLKTYHDLGSEYLDQLNGKEQWMLPKVEPAETMCHGDFAPYNVVMDGENIVGIIDFDTLHPGPRLWDLGYVFYRWIPLMAPDNPENFGTEDDKKRRLNLFKSAYGINNISDIEIIWWTIRRLEFLVDFMKNEASNGDETFQKNIRDGHLDSYLNDLVYLEKLIESL